ncbi:hypothetical protein MKW94_002520 [Papaver nudicaule]|uniref:inositol-1,3,4-trisphosphate 5/6-kinase n=1 Tax=Papaver nudicaule TaxID=74823 RepID=A0AA41VKA2_PAPNU|nr:hypothetical protein [Papaver nudicaule]
MLQVVDDLKLSEIETATATFGIPKQIVVKDFDSLVNVNVVEGLELKFPVIAKPLVVDGSAESHKLSLVYNRDGLSKLEAPVVLQEFVNHGGVIFKVYVVGDYVKCVKRKSLPDVSEEQLGRVDLEESCVAFSQISNKTSEADSGGMSTEVKRIEDAVMPPDGLITDIARGLGKAMGLHLFNFDVIRDSRIGNHYVVIDINYFPGYEKMPCYETVLTDFFCDLRQRKQNLSTEGRENEEQSSLVGSGN